MHSGYLDAEEPMPNKASRTLEMTHQRNQRKIQLDEAGVPQVVTSGSFQTGSGTTTIDLPILYALIFPFFAFLFIF